VASKGQRTRQRIVDQALQLFSVKGYYHTAINDILQATQLTKGGLYGHFPSKEAIWFAVYDQALTVWHGIVFDGVRGCADPMARIRRIIANHLQAYLGGDCFAGGCFFVNMLVELSGQSHHMSRHILVGFVQFSKLIRGWLEAAGAQGCLVPHLNHREVANFILVAMNGAATLYMASRDKSVLDLTQRQLEDYLDRLLG